MRRPLRTILSLLGLSALIFSSAAKGQNPAAKPAEETDSARPLESWADPALSVTRGLTFWLDSGRVNAARRSHGLTEVAEGATVETWYDASGHHRDFTQVREQARPQYLDGGLRFDGESSYLERSSAIARLKDFTLFVVAAPLSNPGGFRAFVAMHQTGRDDYLSAVTVDLGAGFTGRFDTINVEGKGFGGMANLMTTPLDFGVIHQISVTSTHGQAGTKFFLDGQAGRSRDRSESTFDIDRLLVGARFFGFPPSTQGFFEGDILQVLLYDRVLDDAERQRVEGYLKSRIGSGSTVRPPRPGIGKPLVSVPNPPPVQMLVPGFSSRELPLDLTNINNIRYRSDGKLFALAYDGDIYLLSDQDNDGVEETSVRFWDNNGSLVAPIGMALTPPGYSLGEGVFVASKGKVSLIVDTDRDGKADKEIMVAQGWKELPHGVDALGVALDTEGNVYFGLGTTDFTNAYVVDPKGKAAYNLKDEHGTIQKVSPDFRHREIIATGIRFPVGMAFNRLGDLFATDQEGATWLPNGNPFDELLHIQTGRHYGFPPRHPTHLPSVIDEPSVFDYTPQHQSTCGLFFNEPMNGGPNFGPAEWAGDALVTGYSRGKLFRTKLVKTSAGYVAQNQLFAVLNMLAADACVSPRGELVVAVHSGQPDWGSGPKGKGKLYKISYSGREIPQPVLAWASGPQEVRIAFDRPLDPSKLGNLLKRTSIELGQAVQPGDRFESLRPGYEVVGRQMRSPRFDLPILSAQVASDRRSLLLATAPHPQSSSYAITLKDFPRARPEEAQGGKTTQVPDIELGYDLSGVQAEWKPEADGEAWIGWLPHLDPIISRALTIGSSEHDRLWKALEKPGRLTLKTKINLDQMLRPAVQPGSTPGYRLPDEDVAITLTASKPFTMKTSAEVTTLEVDKEGRHRVLISVKPKAQEPLPIEISMMTDGSSTLDVTWTTREDDRPRAFPLRRFLLPWSSSKAKKIELVNREIPELKGGDWARGRAVFYSEAAKCSSCHKVRGRGNEIGPDLSNLVHRDYTSVLRDIHTPSAAINPDYVAHAVALHDGRVLQGTLRVDGDRLIVADTAGRQTTLRRSEIETTSPSAISIMPEGLDTALGPDKLRDLLTFLLTDPLGPATLENEGAPPPRRRSELEAVLKGSTPVQNSKPLKVILAGGPKDHGPGEHDYPLWLKRWSALLATDSSVSVETSEGWPSTRQLETANIVVFYSNNPGWDATKAKELDGYFARGGGVVLIHFAVDGHQAVEALSDRIGLAWQGGKSAFRHGPLDIDFAQAKHPITRGFGTLKLVDESYWNLVGNPDSVEVLGSGIEGGQPRPLFWTKQAGKGRVFVSIPGHYTWTFDDPLFRLILLRGMAWTAGESVDRFNELTTLGARMGE